MTLGQIAYDRWRALHAGQFAHPLTEWAGLSKGVRKVWEEVAFAVAMATKEKK